MSERKGEIRLVFGAKSAPTVSLSSDVTTRAYRAIDFSTPIEACDLFFFFNIPEHFMYHATLNVISDVGWNINNSK